MGGDFGNIGGQTRSRIAKLSERRATRSQPGTPARMTSYAPSPPTGAVYAGGLFDTISGVARNGIAKLSPANGAEFAFNPDATGSEVSALRLVGPQCMPVGLFTQIGGKNATGSPKLSTTSGNAFSSLRPETRLRASTRSTFQAATSSSAEASQRAGGEPGTGSRRSRRRAETRSRASTRGQQHRLRTRRFGLGALRRRQLPCSADKSAPNRER